MTTAQERLAEVRRCISEVLQYGQSVRKDGREVRMADLASLRLLEKQYAAEAQAQQSFVKRRPRNRVFYGSI